MRNSSPLTHYDYINLYLTKRQYHEIHKLHVPTWTNNNRYITREKAIEWDRISFMKYSFLQTKRQLQNRLSNSCVATKWLESPRVLSSPPPLSWWVYRCDWNDTNPYASKFISANVIELSIIWNHSIGLTPSAWHPVHSTLPIIISYYILLYYIVTLLFQLM